jgi:hypothetical protein
MKLCTRVLLSIPLWGMAAVCILGFWASFETGGFNAFDVIYGPIGIALIIGGTIGVS